MAIPGDEVAQDIVQVQPTSTALSHPDFLVWLRRKYNTVRNKDSRVRPVEGKRKK
jgi:hypothetical protein